MTLSQSSDGVWRKFARAEKHFGNYKAELNRATEANGRLTSTIEEEVYRRKYFFDAMFNVPDGLRLGLMYGDFVHNLRSSLDHLAYRLAVAASGVDPPPNEKRVAFPIYDSRIAFYRHWRYHRKGKGDGKGAFVPRGGMTILEGLQPYPRRHRPHLRLLRDLDDMDKHRLVAEVLSIPHRLKVSPETMRALHVFGVERVHSVLNAQTGAARFVFEGTDIGHPADVEVDMQFSVFFEPIIDFDGTGWPLRKAGDEMINEVRAAIDALVTYL